MGVDIIWDSAIPSIEATNCGLEMHFQAMTTGRSRIINTEEYGIIRTNGWDVISRKEMA